MIKYSIKLNGLEITRQELGALGLMSDEFYELLETGSVTIENLVNEGRMNAVITMVEQL